MKKILYSVLFAVFCLPAWGYEIYPVAIVGDDVITNYTLSRRVSLIAKMNKVPVSKALASQVLDFLVQEKIKLIYANKTGIQASNEEVNEYKKRLTEQNNSFTELRKTLSEGENEELDQQLRAEFIWQKIIGIYVIPRIQDQTDNRVFNQKVASLAQNLYIKIKSTIHSEIIMQS